MMGRFLTSAHFLLVSAFIFNSAIAALDAEMQFPADMDIATLSGSDHGPVPTDSIEEDAEEAASSEIAAAESSEDEEDAEEDAEEAASSEIAAAESSEDEEDAEEKAEEVASSEIAAAESSEDEEDAEEDAEEAASSEIAAAESSEDEEDAEEKAEEVASSEIAAAESSEDEEDAEEKAEEVASSEIAAAESSEDEEDAEEKAEEVASSEIAAAESSEDEEDAEERAEAVSAPQIEASFPIIEPSSSSDSVMVSETVPHKESDQDYFNFGMMSLGIEGGVSLSEHSYHSNVGAGSNVDFSGTYGALGLRLTWEKFFGDYWTAGVTGSLRYYLGEVSGSHQAVTAFNLSYAVDNLQRYELAAKAGKWMGAFHPYVKVGAVVGDFSVKALDSTSASSKRQWAWGGTLGGGVETQVSKDLILGGSIEYDRYLRIKNNLVNSRGIIGQYTTTPSFLSAMVTLSCKLDKFF